MSFAIRSGVFSTIALACIVAAVPAQAPGGQLPTNAAAAAADTQAAAAVSRIFAGILSETSPHMRMGPTRTATVADSARAKAIVAAARAALGKYADVKVAERDGYYRILPLLTEQPIYHYNNAWNIGEADKGHFDVTKPVSLLYKKTDDGQLRLVGVMYAAGVADSPDSLDSRLPVSMAHWHQHVNLCWPSKRVAQYLSDKPDAGMVFWLRLFFSITTERECEYSGGQFVPDSGWMAHVYLFAGDDPRVIWDTDDAGDMGGMGKMPL